MLIYKRLRVQIVALGSHAILKMKMHTCIFSVAGFAQIAEPLLLPTQLPAAEAFAVGADHFGY